MPGKGRGQDVCVGGEGSLLVAEGRVVGTTTL